jgi:hypothetical protein
MVEAGSCLLLCFLRVWIAKVYICLKLLCYAIRDKIIAFFLEMWYVKVLSTF